MSISENLLMLNSAFLDTGLALDELLKNEADSIKTPGSVSIVKSVQRGTTSSTNVSISTVNPNKCIVIINNGVLTGSASGENTTGAYITALTATQLTITQNTYYAYSKNDGTNTKRTSRISWQVIEFY